MANKNIFYVYAHVRKSDGRFFYVGKGKNKRAWETYKRSKWWFRVSEIHGYEVQVMQSDMIEQDAVLLEMWLIAKFKNEGHPLVNMTHGGEGMTGYSHTQESIRKSRSTKEPKRVYCSNGMNFDSVGEARYWLIESGHEKAHVSNIRKCANGAVPGAYGYKWSFKDGVFHERTTGYSYLSSEIFIFDHVSGIKFIGSRRYFCKKFGFSACSGYITLLLRGGIPEYQGWRVTKDG